MKKVIIILMLLSTIIIAKKITPRVIHVHDRVKHEDDNLYRNRDYVNYGGYESSDGYNEDYGRGDNPIGISTQATVGVSTIATSEGTSQSTSGRGGRGVPRSRPRYYKPITFLKKNRDIIMEDVSKGEGEHLTTLLKLLKLKRDSSSLSKIQKNFNSLLTLNSIDFIYKLEKLDKS